MSLILPGLKLKKTDTTMMPVPWKICHLFFLFRSGFETEATNKNIPERHQLIHPGGAIAEYFCHQTIHRFPNPLVIGDYPPSFKTFKGPNDVHRQQLWHIINDGMNDIQF